MQDLHLHLSGSTDPVLLYEMIRRQGLKLKTKDFDSFKDSLLMKKDKVKNLDEYVAILHVIDEVQSSPQGVRQSFYKSYADAYLVGCRYLELRWNPYKRSMDYKIDFDNLIESARAGYEEAKMIFGIHGGQILCLGRDVDQEANDAIFKKALKYYEKGVVGIDIAGSERKYPIVDRLEFETYYKQANAKGLITTCHIGEEFYDGVEDALALVIEKYQSKRIGHGIQIHRFPKLMKIAAQKGVMFEICISSNLMTRNVADKKEYAKILKIFEDNQLNYTICTDSVYPLQTNLAEEYRLHAEIMAIARG